MSSSGSKVRVTIVEDQTIFREMLREVLHGTERYQVVAEVALAADAKEALSSTATDLLIIDCVLPDQSGVDLLADVKQSHPRLPIVMVTGFARPALVRRCVELGAQGFVTKSAPLKELREGVDRVVQGGKYYCSETSSLLADALQRPEEPDSLTKRQRQIVQLVARGLSSKEIAQELDLSLKTVANHRLQIREKLDVHDVAGLTRFAIQHGLVEPKL